ncbi:conserved hypothetical protein [Solidesulfovibrio fructosivorans JJ]]|uniref:Uncharacterized protein n=1 Tax=Solidesulfovibrio fructosivorans JJ] TaxID=596151 RepID=E1JSJ1_SOLFR|nr:Spy/CpxP family protein refolding chaperone [Solidesulfovibrio fructosivorans]EFL52676.1 conserved hypothetical protein [Solidesulfovibrio fructosivorans JJ]]
MRKVCYAILTLVILAGSAYAVAAGPGPGGPGPAGLLGRLLSLNLSDAQKHEVAVILKQNRSAFEAAGRAMHEAFDTMRKIMRTDPGNEQSIRQASRKIAAAGEELAVLRGKVTARVLAVLTPEQRKHWDEGEMSPPPNARGAFHADRELVDDWINTHAGPTN